MSKGTSWHRTCQTCPFRKVFAKPSTAFGKVHREKRVKPYPPSFSNTADETNAREKNKTFCASLFFHSCRRSSKVCQHPIAAMQDGGLLGPRRFCARVHSQKVTYPVTLFRHHLSLARNMKIHVPTRTLPPFPSLIRHCEMHSQQKSLSCKRLEILWSSD